MSEHELQPADEHGGQPPEEGGEAPTAATAVLTLGREPEPVPLDVRDVSFGVALRGYNREQVDSYVEHVNRVIAELDVTRSPQNAVKLALDRVVEQTAGVLEQAREAAEELTATAVAEADHATRRARVEAQELLERARTESAELVDNAAAEAEQLQEHAQVRLGELRAQITEAQTEHERVLGLVRATAARLEQFALDAVEPAPPIRDEADEAGGPEVADRPGEADRPTDVMRGRAGRPAAKR